MMEFWNIEILEMLECGELREKRYRRMREDARKLFRPPSCRSVLFPTLFLNADSRATSP